MMHKAIAQARLAWEAEEVPVGAVVYCGDRIISTGHNLRESHTDPTAHAEIIALRKAAKTLGEWRLTDCTLVVTLEPCCMCAGAIVLARIDRLIYGAADPKAGAVETLYQLCTDSRLNHQVEVVPGVLAEKCGAMLTAFFRRQREMGKK